MSNCVIKGDPESIFNYLNNGIVFWDLGTNPTRKSSLESFEYLEQQFAEGAIERKAFKDENGEDILKYVWTNQGTEHVFHKSPSMYSKDAWSKKYANAVTDKFGQFSLQVGTTVHYAMQELMLKRAGISNRSKAEILKEITANKDHANLSASTMSLLEQRVNELYNLAVAHQQKIDSTQDVAVKVEVPVINPMKSLMGTQDLMFVFSDNTAWDFDYKTSILTNDKLDSNRQPKDIIENHVKRNSHTEQMRAYKEAKEEYHGIQVTRSEIIPIGIVVDGIRSKVGIKANSVNELTVTKAFSSDELNSKARRTPSNLYSSDIESLSEQAGNTHRLITDLQTKAKASRKRKDRGTLQRYSQSLALLDKMNQELIGFKSIDVVYKTMLDVLKNIPDSLYEPMLIDQNGVMVENEDAISTEELLMLQKQMNQLLEFEEVLKDIVATEYDIKPTRNKQTDPVVKKLDELRSKILTNMGVEDINTFDLIESKLDEITNILTQRTQYRIGDEKLSNGRIVTNALGIWERYLTVHGEIDNPAMRALGKLNNIAHQRANRNYSARSSVFLKKATEAANYANTIGKSQEAMMNMLVDENTGDMISTYRKEFDDDFQNAIERKDSTWIKEHHELKDEATFKKTLKERFDAKLAVLRRNAGWTEQNGYPTELIKNDVEREITEWKLKNDLLNSSAAWLNKGQVKKHAKIKNAEEYYTAEYEALFAHEPILEFFHEYSNLWADMREILGVGYGRLPDNFIPNVKKELIDTLSTADSRTIGKDLSAIFSDSFMANEVDRITMRNENNNESYQAPMMYLDPLHKDQNKAIRAKSYDIISSALLFMKMTYTHEALTETLPDAEMILNFLADPNNVKQAATGGTTQRKKNYFGNVSLDKLGIKESDIYERAKKMFDYNWLGIRYGQSDNWPKIGGTFNPETGETVGSFDTAKAVLTVRNLNIQAALGFNAISAAGANLGAFARGMIIGREKLAYTREQFLEAARGFANEDERNKQILLTAYFNTSAEGTQRKDIWDSKNLVKGLAKKGELRKWMSSEGLLKFFSGGDAVLSNIVTGAMLRNFGYDPAKGKIRRLELCPDGTKSLWEIAQINEDTGQISFEGVPNEQIGEMNEEIFYSAVRLTMKSITGQLNDQELMGLQETILGTLFTTYRTWLPSILQSEFGKPKYIEQFEAMKEGRMNSLWKNYFYDYGKIANDKGVRISLKSTLGGVLNLSKDVLSTALFLKSIESEDFLRNDVLNMEYDIWESKYKEKAAQLGDTREERLRKWRDMKYRNVISGLAMLRTIAATMTLSSMALAIDLDEDDKADVLENYVTRQIFRVLNRATNELATPISPGEILSIGDVSIPAISFFHNTLKGLYNAADESLEVISGVEDARDKTPFMYYTSRNIPFGNQLYKMLYKAFYTNPAPTRDTRAAVWRALGL